MIRHLCTALTLLAATPALADPALTVTDAYARAASPVAKSGAVFMVIANAGDSDDRLLSVTTGAAVKAELHSHLMDTNGIARMVKVEDGIAIPAGGEARLKRGGDHVMMMGLTGPLENGGEITLALTFETSGTLTVAVPVDNERMPDAAGHGGAMSTH